MEGERGPWAGHTCTHAHTKTAWVEFKKPPAPKAEGPGKLNLKPPLSQNTVLSLFLLLQ